MSSRAGFSIRAALGAFFLAVATACAPKISAPPSLGAPRFPEFLFPAIPQGIGTPGAVEHHEIGWQWLQAGDLRAAERNFAASLKLSPALYPAEAGLGYVALARKDNNAAALHFDRAVVANPRYAPALVGRGDALLALGQRDAALKSFEAAIVADPGLTTLRDRIEVLRFHGLKEDVAAARKAAESGRLAEARTAYERAVAASPESPFLYRELAIVERTSGDWASALANAQKAADLEPTEARHLVLLGEIHEAQGDLSKAIEAYEAAVALEPDPAMETRIDDLREKTALAAMPPEYKSIEGTPTVTRAQLAALLGVRLDGLLKRSPRRNAVVITDTRGNWSTPWILSVARAGVMEVYANHTFQPDAIVRRADLAQAASRVLSLIAVDDPSRAAEWRISRRRFLDVSQGHLSYPAVSIVVEAGVMNATEDGSFQLTRPVTGQEAMAAVRKLEELAEHRGR